MNKMHYHFKVNKETNGYWAQCIELDGCITQADTLDELKANMEEVLNLYLDEPNTSDMIFSLPNQTEGQDYQNILDLENREDSHDTPNDYNRQNRQDNQAVHDKGAKQNKENKQTKPNTTGDQGEIFKVKVYPQVAFAMIIRMLRLKKSLTQTQTANLLGMKNLYSYQRLESSKHLNPSLTMLMRLKHIFPELKVDDILS